MKLPTIRANLLAAACSVACVVGSTQPVFANQSVSSLPEQQRQPNVVLIFADDLGYSDTGFQNISKDVRTPNLDRLAEDGAILTAGYVTAPVSGPSRAGMLTGRYQQRFGAHDNVGPYVREEGMEQGVPVDIPTIGNYFQDAGYRTAIVGKWHDGDPKKFWPHNRGFDEFFGFNNGAADYFVGAKNVANAQNAPFSSMYRNDELVEPFDEYLTDRFGSEAVNFIERNKNEPFFLYVPFNAIHGPLQALEDDLARFDDIENPLRRLSVAMNYNMDHNVGRIIAKLEEHKLMEDTIIVFLSDNGGKFMGKHGNKSYNHPLRGEKVTVWDGGIRIPFTITWKGTIPARQVIDEPIISLDLLPTLLSAAGAKEKAEWKLDGLNLIPLLTGKASHLEDRYLFWHMPRQAAVRDRNWKLVMPDLLSENTAPQLFKISEDIAESRDLAADYPEQVERLKGAFLQWSAENEEPRWGWNKQRLPYSNGWRGRE
ncbi:sulfatase-like hydrolase/transferase [Photobacterium sp. OFAV2-7]|uniref:sulfatase-like hydrolase/transferase n=1 Tax=Photobacterium sp. OFAV2-7 TaxID=2917748 RepID=UPI001EF6EA99|nr:sulfatase-like hydrolase/transferase [Photobacterium sp. OFAV2-7]MCG7585603.1 sulfatase-like hydrolase/transferase [Photobacterium sp. OFAV2-7]